MPPALSRGDRAMIRLAAAGSEVVLLDTTRSGRRVWIEQCCRSMRTTAKKGVLTSRCCGAVERCYCLPLLTSSCSGEGPTVEAQDRTRAFAWRVPVLLWAGMPVQLYWRLLLCQSEVKTKRVEKVPRSCGQYTPGVFSEDSRGRF